MCPAHAAENSRLEDVRVLVLVNEHVIVKSCNPGRHLWRRFQKQGPEEEQVVVVDEIPRLLSCGVIGEDLSEILEIIHELWILVAKNVLDADAGVDVPRVNVLQRFLLRKAFAFGRVSQLRPRETEEVFRISLVHDGEILGKTRCGAEPPQQPVCRRVKRSAMYVAAVATHEALGPGQHLLCCASSEGEKQNAIGTDAALDEVRYAVDERPGFSGSGAGDDEEGPFAMRRRSRLLRVQLGGEVPR